jgi:hypothetical protein
MLRLLLLWQHVDSVMLPLLRTDVSQRSTAASSLGGRDGSPLLCTAATNRNGDAMAALPV